MTEQRQARPSPWRPACPDRGGARRCGAAAPGSASRVRACLDGRGATAAFLLLGTLAAGCGAVSPPADTAPSVDGPAQPAAPRPGEGSTLHELVHRNVLADPRLDECLEDRGGGPDEPLEIDLGAHPSGALEFIESRGGVSSTAGCVRRALAHIRLPPGSVDAPRRVTLTLR